MLLAESLDDDIDGIENSIDQCPNSKITDIVDENGCSVEELSYPVEHHFDITLGYGYTQFDSNTSQSAQSFSFAYYYGEALSFLFYTSNYDLDSGENGVDDSTFQVSYMKEYHDTYLGFSLGAYLPTFDIPDNKTDYFLKLSATKELADIDITTSYQYTMMQDTLTQNTNYLELSFGGTPIEELYTSLSYTIQDSIYKDEGTLQYASLYTHYPINDIFFIDTSFSMGLNTQAVKNSFQLSLGYSY